MTGLEVVQQLMAEIGPRMKFSEVTEFTEDESWVLVVDDETVIAVDYDPAGARIVFSAEVAEPPAQKRLATYEQLLMFNHQWPETGGLRFALDGPAGVAVLSYDLPLDGIDIQALEESLATFVQQITVWRGQITEGAGDDSPDPEPDSLPPPGIIRA